MAHGTVVELSFTHTKLNNVRLKLLIRYLFYIFHVKNKNYSSQESLHGRELTCVKYLRSTAASRICVTASEDTFINVVTFTGSEVKVIHRLHGHISSVRTLAVSDCNTRQGTCKLELLLNSTCLPPISKVPFKRGSITRNW